MLVRVRVVGTRQTQACEYRAEQRIELRIQARQDVPVILTSDPLPPSIGNTLRSVSDVHGLRQEPRGSQSGWAIRAESRVLRRGRWEAAGRPLHAFRCDARCMVRGGIGRPLLPLPTSEGP